MLVDKRGLSMNVDTYSRTNLPSSSTYTFQTHFFDTYTEAEKLTTDLQTKQDALMVIAEQFFAELRTRTESGAKGFYLGDVSLGVQDEAQADQLIQVSYDVEIIVKTEDCTLGTFNY
jgi:hypothetical protein